MKKSRNATAEKRRNASGCEICPIQASARLTTRQDLRSSTLVLSSARSTHGKTRYPAPSVVAIRDRIHGLRANKSAPERAPHGHFHLSRLQKKKAAAPARSCRKRKSE